MEPLKLPRGSVRAILTIILVCIAGATLFVPVTDDRAMGMILALAVVAVQSYFSDRRSQNAQDGPAVAPPVSQDEV